MRTAAKRDANEGPIKEALKAAGASVTPLSAAGVPDLLVGFRGETFLMEVKDGRNDLTEDQQNWHADWRGRQVWIVRTVEEALFAIGVIE